MTILATNLHSFRCTRHLGMRQSREPLAQAIRHGQHTEKSRPPDARWKLARRLSARRRLYPPRCFPAAPPDALELLDLSARRQLIPLVTLKWACFVRDFNSGEPANPERLLRTTFSGRPRLAGVWLRMTLKDETVLEGMAANDLTLLDPAGLLITPPDTRSNTQRIFLPRSGITELTIVSVIGASATAAPKRKPPASDRGQADSLPRRNAQSVVSHRVG